MQHGWQHSSDENILGRFLDRLIQTYSTPVARKLFVAHTEPWFA
jgi:hypothetical protein